MRKLVINLLFFLSLTSIIGSCSLMADPTGESLRIPIDLLDSTPFSNYFLPGLFLLLINGIPAFIIAILTIKKINSYPFLVISQGGLLMLWLTAQNTLQ